MTLLNVLLRDVKVTYRICDDVTEEQCKLFLGDTRNVFLMIHEVLPDDPLVALLCRLSGVNTEKSGKMRTAIVASIMLPFESRLRAKDEEFLVSPNGMFMHFNKIASDLLASVWFKLSKENQKVLWSWIHRILDRLSVLAEPIPPTER